MKTSDVELPVELPDQADVDPTLIEYGGHVMTKQGVVCSSQQPVMSERDPRRGMRPNIVRTPPRVVGSYRIEMPAQSIILRWLDPSLGKASELGAACDHILEQLVERCPADEVTRVHLLRFLAVHLGMPMLADPSDRTSLDIAGGAPADLASLRDQVFELRDCYNETIYQLNSSRGPRLSTMSDIRLQRPMSFSFACVRRLATLLKLAERYHRNGLPLLSGVTNMKRPGIDGSKSIEQLCDYDRGTAMQRLLHDAWRIGIADALGLTEDNTPPPAAA